MARRTSRVSAALGAIELEFRALVYRDDDLWIAHCLECDLATQGNTADDAVAELRDALDSLIEYALEKGDLRPLYRPAPLALWTQFAEISEEKSPEPRRSRHCLPRFGLRTECVQAGSE